MKYFAAILLALILACLGVLIYAGYEYVTIGHGLHPGIAVAACVFAVPLIVCGLKCNPDDPWSDCN